jgi:tetratricopeptide (TPR) repeat protein
LNVGAKIDLAAVRLEALTHPSLPGTGPGRYPGRSGLYRGTFAQESWMVTATPPNQKKPITLVFDNGWADHQLEDHPIQSDGQWNIALGGEGRNCRAVWTLSKPVPLATGTMLAFDMEGHSFQGSGENLGHFRLAVSSHPAALDWEKKRFAAMQLTDPWARLAAAYHLLRDPQALDKSLRHHPAAAVGIGDVYAGAQDWERAIVEYRKTLTDLPADSALLTKIAAAYQGAGRTREGIPYLAKASLADPANTQLSLAVAACQAWFGQDRELAATRKRILAFAKDTDDRATAERAARACSMLPSDDKAEHEAVLALGRKAAELGKGGRWQEWSLLARGMAEYRSGNDAAAAEALLAATKAGPNNAFVASTAAFYRAMSLFRQGKKEQARKLAIAAAAKMKPLPKDEHNPLAGDADLNDPMLWLAYKEAKAMLQFEAAVPPKERNDKK